VAGLHLLVFAVVLLDRHQLLTYLARTRPGRTRQ
jgi:hypothetical protein